MPELARTSLFALLTALLPPALAAEAAELSVRDGWVRQTPPNRTVAAAYLTVANGRAAPLALVGAESPDARVELHTMLREDGLMRMRPLDRLEIPAGGSASLAPGGAHLMLFDVDATRTGSVVDLELLFEDGTRLPLSLPVRRNAPGRD